MLLRISLHNNSTVEELYVVYRNVLRAVYTVVVLVTRLYAMTCDAIAISANKSVARASEKVRDRVS